MSDEVSRNFDAEPTEARDLCAVPSTEYVEQGNQAWTCGVVVVMGDLAAPALSDEAFGVVYRAEVVGLTRLAVLLLGNLAAAEDVVQEVFMSWFRHAATVEQPGAYLRRSVINGCHNRYRSVSRESARLVRLAAQPSSDNAITSEVEVLDLLDGLDARRRAALVLRYWLGWSEAEIATALGCRPGTVKSMTARSLADLRKDLTR